MRLTVISLCFIALVACEQKPVSDSNYPETDVEMKLTKVAPSTYFVQGVAGVATDNEGFVSNAGFVVTREGVVVFDALGTPSLAYKFLGLIRTITDKPILKLIVSHYHADHIYGIQVFKEQGAKVYAPSGAMEYLSNPAAEERLEERRFSLEPWVNESTYLVTPDVIVDKPIQFKHGEIAFTIDVLGAAHSEGDLTMYVETERVLFSGDIIFEGRVPFLGDANTRRWLETLEKMQTSRLVALIPGHGGLAKNPNEAVKATRNYLAKVREAMSKGVKELEDFSVIYDSTDWSEFEKFPAFDAANRRNAYQVYLSMEEELFKK